ncbi:MAG: TetR/AcrR family transcriptional regulator, partial [Clostridia bacterium]|nr:TetR/AcrR family transcriptional regulator [Clostridia bacterium]
MPPKVKITKKEIVDKALELLRQKGPASLNARTVATALGSSTQPVFSNFATMDELKEAVKLAAYDRYLSFLEKESRSGKYPRYKSFGMAYIRFAKEEKELFKLIFMCDRDGRELVPTNDFNASVELIMNSNGVSREKAELMHLEMWACVHGIAVMLSTSFLELRWELISNILTDVYQGIRKRHLEENNGRN